MHTPHSKPVFDNGTFQVYLNDHGVEFGFGDEYAFGLSDLLDLVDFLKETGVRLFHDDPVKQE